MGMFDIFKKKIKQRGLYAVTYGEYSGCFLLYIKERNAGDALAFWMIPHPTTSIFLNKDEVEVYVTNGVLKLHQIVPKSFYGTYIKQFDLCAKKEGFVLSGIPVS